MYRVIICDDDPEFADFLFKMCETILTDKEIPCELELCYSADEVLDNYMQGKPADLLILGFLLSRLLTCYKNFC